MKKLYILIFAANLFSAQSSELLNTNWQVTKFIGEFFPTDQTPPPMPYQQITTFNSNPSKLNLSFFNTVSGDLNFTSSNQFTLSNKVCTMADYTGDNGEVNQFFNNLCSFFSNENYYYFIENNGSEKTLKIGNAIFQEIQFKSATLGTKDNELNRISVYPNPATDIIIIENLKTNFSLELIDNSGKLVKSISNQTSKTEINIKNLASGIYYLKVDGQSVQKIIKK